MELNFNQIFHFAANKKSGIKKQCTGFVNITSIVTFILPIRFITLFTSLIMLWG